MTVEVISRRMRRRWQYDPVVMAVVPMVFRAISPSIMVTVDNAP